jgi:hypothetical protein
VLGCILDLIVCGREEDGFPKAPKGANDSGLRGQVGIRMSESSEGNDSVLKLLKHICSVLGIDLDAVRVVDVAEGSAIPPADEKSYEDDLLDGYQEPYGWPELQIGVVREAVAVSEALPGWFISPF